MLSIIVPFYNEEKNVSLLYDELRAVLSDSKYEYKILFVNDGSSDNGGREIEHIKKNDTHVMLLTHRRRLGKGTALHTGLDNEKGEVIVFMDADLQDDPRDLPAFLQKIDEGYDFVNGIRIDRRDNFMIKTYSRIARLFLNIFLRSPFTDINCGFKAFKREVLDEVSLYGNNFRFFK